MSERDSVKAAALDESGGRVAAKVESSAGAALSASDGTDAEENLSLLKQLTVGTTVDGKYKIDEIIGRGAMGVVVAATHIHLKERVALKFLNARAHGTGEDFHSRFRREAQVSAKLRNEHITRVIDVGVWRERLPFMVMDHLSGVDLRRALKQGGPLPMNVALDYIIQLCEGLAEAHSYGIIHRDLKPSNLFVIKRPDGTDLLKILDFGISKWSSHEQDVEELTQTGVVLGSPKYMSPEQLFGSATVDARADIWSIGAIFYEMLAGRPPYDFPTLTRICAELASDRPPPSLRTFVADIPAQLEAAVLTCFMRDREQRARNVAELAGALLEAVDAPFAGHVKQKIASILDPKSSGVTLTASSGGLALHTSGDYRSLAISGAPGPLRTSSGAIRVADTNRLAAAAASEHAAGPVVDEPKRGKALVVVGAIVALLVVGVGAFLFGGRASTSEQTKSMGAQVAPPPPLTADPSPAPLPVASAAPSPPAPASAAAPAAPSTPVPPEPANAGGAGNHGGGGGGRPWHPHPHTQGGTSPPPPAAASPPPAPTQPTATPAAPAAATAKTNPLEDRQ